MPTKQQLVRYSLYIAKSLMNWPNPSLKQHRLLKHAPGLPQKYVTYLICNIFNMQSSQRLILTTVLQIYYSTGISSIIAGINNANIGLEIFISKPYCSFGYGIFH